MTSSEKNIAFFPRDLWFWLAHIAGWSVYLVPAIASKHMLDIYHSQAITADITRFLISIPVLLMFRHLYNRHKWYLIHPFELLSLMLGFNFISAFFVAYIVQYNIWLSHEVLPWFHSDFMVASRDADEIQRSWLYSFVLQVMWCFVYLVVKSNTRTQSSEQEKIRVENELKDAQINTLMGQISPHFLFNGMNNIINLMDENVPKAQHSLRAFSDMLRFSLASNKREKVPLEEEIHLVESYLSLESIQLEDKLTYKIHVSDSARALFVPPMMIQMLVENSIKHGISLQKNGGELKVIIDDSGKELIFMVSNDGCLNPMDGSSAVVSTRVGIDNIRQRLDLLYGGRARLDLMQEGDKVIAEIHIPRILCE